MDLTGTPWRKSSYSNTQADCVEVRAAGPVVAVRDSKDPGGPALVMSPGAWRALTGGVKAG